MFSKSKISRAWIIRTKIIQVIVLVLRRYITQVLYIGNL